MNIIPRNIYYPQGWPNRAGAGGYAYDLDASQNFVRTRHNASTGRNVQAWYNVTTGYAGGYRRGMDDSGPPAYTERVLSTATPKVGLPPPRLMAGFHPMLPLLDPQVYALMLGRRISGPWLGDVRAGGVPWETAIDTTRPFGRKRG